jgi:ketosteroid isomerase-like protein
MPQRPGTFNCIGGKTMTNERADIRNAIERFVASRFAKDCSIIDQFEPDAILAGSAAPQLHYGREEIAEHFEAAMGAAYTLRHDWQRLDIRQDGTTAWFFAHGNAMIGSDGIETPAPVRVSGVLVRNGDAWRFQLLHVAEPVSQ